MIEAGRYKARANAGAQFGNSKNKGTPFVRVTFTIVEGEHAGQSVPWDGYFAEKTTARTIDSLRYCGCTFPDNNIDDLTGLEDNEVEIQVAVEPYENDQGEMKEFAKVAWVNQIGGGYRLKDEVQMSDGQRAQFRNRLKGAIVHATKGAVPKPMNGSKPKPPPNRNDSVGGGYPSRADDDIPFGPLREVQQ